RILYSLAVTFFFMAPRIVHVQGTGRAIFDDIFSDTLSDSQVIESSPTPLATPSSSSPPSISSALISVWGGIVVIATLLSVYRCYRRSRNTPQRRRLRAEVTLPMSPIDPALGTTSSQPQIAPAATNRRSGETGITLPSLLSPMSSRGGRELRDNATYASSGLLTRGRSGRAVSAFAASEFLRDSEHEPSLHSSDYSTAVSHIRPLSLPMSITTEKTMVDYSGSGRARRTSSKHADRIATLAVFKETNATIPRTYAS
ncbi:hypothetical protein BKA62DRAFT_720784, partial [Auriculariales sp. MPI-PUGE-AT-0066]